MSKSATDELIEETKEGRRGKPQHIRPKDLRRMRSRMDDAEAERRNKSSMLSFEIARHFVERALAASSDKGHNANMGHAYEWMQQVVRFEKGADVEDLSELEETYASLGGTHSVDLGKL